MKRRAVVCALTFVLGACGGTKGESKAPVLATVDTNALKKMVRGVESADTNRNQAVDLLKDAVRADPNLWEARYNLAVLLAQQGDLAEAETQLEEAARLAPNAEDVAVALGEVRRRRGEPEAAADGLSAFIRSYPKAIAARIALVRALRESGRTDQAIEQAREVLVRRSDDPSALAELALSHLERDEMDTADLLSEESLKAEPRTAVAERTAGLIALRRGDDAIAFQHFVKASELDPKDTAARLNMGSVLLRAGIYDRAEGQFRAVLEVDPDDDAATLGLAAAVRGQGSRDRPDRFLEAEKLLKGLLDRTPNHLAARFNLAVLYADFLNKPADAKPLFESFLADAPQSDRARGIAEKWLADRKAAPAAPGGASPAAASATTP